MINQVLDENKSAQIMGLAVQTLRNWRYLGKGPPYLKLGGLGIGGFLLEVQKNNDRGLCVLSGLCGAVGTY